MSCLSRSWKIVCFLSYWSNLWRGRSPPPDTLVKRLYVRTNAGRLKQGRHDYPGLHWTKIMKQAWENKELWVFCPVEPNSEIPNGHSAKQFRWAACKPGSCPQEVALFPRRNGSNHALKTNQESLLLSRPSHVHLIYSHCASPPCNTWVHGDGWVAVRQTCKWAIRMLCNMETQISKELIHLHPGIGCTQETRETCHMLSLKGRHRDFMDLVCAKGKVGRELACW